MDAPATAVLVCAGKGQRGWGKHACYQHHQQKSGRQTMHVLRKKSTKGRISRAFTIIQARSFKLAGEGMADIARGRIARRW
jgi:hypothetical protein